MLSSRYLQILWNSLMLFVAVHPLDLPPREATVSGPVSSNQGGVLSGRHSLANSPPNPSPHPAGLVLNHPNQPQLEPKTGLVPNHNHNKQPQPIPASHAGLDPSTSPRLPSLQSPTSLVPLTQCLDGRSALVSLVGLWNPTPTGHLNVPYNLNLQRGIYDKMMITIMGQVKPNAKQFTVNFLRGNDIAFHLNPRFNDGGKQAVVRNHKVGERWGKEERHTQGGFPFMAGQSFEMKILITFEEFKVAVNGAQLFEFKHLVRELNQIDRINILHDVILTYVNIDTIP
ncbi:hypothetical protein J4Q44_G00322010 [Coregonus suidteri]|uniref:Galectin n=1 Tax=Coregonus suidteri TaxID=861788 RepID=A0AAN8QI37_9TELE